MYIINPEFNEGRICVDCPFSPCFSSSNHAYVLTGGPHARRETCKRVRAREREKEREDGTVSDLLVGTRDSKSTP